MPKYVAMWNLPGCLPEMEPVEFDDLASAFDFMADELIRVYGDDDHGSDAYSRASHSCELMANFAIPVPQAWAFHAPNGYVYSVSPVS